MNQLPFWDADLPLSARLDDLLGRLTPAEKAAQLVHSAPAIPRLGIPAYNWWNECLHGVGRAGTATVFPQAIGLAATFDAELVFQVAGVVADEARAKHHAYAAVGDRGIYKGLTFWSPNVNIFRDPRWGRGHETYGECPFLTATLGVSFVRGLQGDDPRYLKLAATAKHFAVHSGPEKLRHGFDARVTRKDLFETYLPAFAALVREARVEAVMTAYNRVNGEPCSASPTLIQRVLREQWRFAGHVVSDCWALRDIHEQHHVTPGPVESAAIALKTGCDLNCGCTYEHLPLALEQGLISEADLDVSLRRLFDVRLRLGMFDPDERVPFAGLPYEVVDSAEHRALARRAAECSLVLLHNDGVLPLDPRLRAIAVAGPNADAAPPLWGNYNGRPALTVTPLEGIRARLPAGARLYFAEGCRLRGTDLDTPDPAGNLSEAVLIARRSDVCVLVLGLSPDLEGEEGAATQSEASGDKVDLALPGLQRELFEAVAAEGKPVVLVLVSGSALDVSFAEGRAAAIVQAFYPGEETGSALAAVLFGDVSPAGRLPITFPRSIDDVPPFEDYDMRGRSYRFATREPLYPFGYGLSYSRFEYGELSLQTSDEQTSEGLRVTLRCRLQNTGSCAADEVVQVYVRAPASSSSPPLHELRATRRVQLAAGASVELGFELGAHAFSAIDDEGQRVLAPGEYRVFVGGSQPDSRSVRLLGQAPLEASFALGGPRLTLEY